jgi:hypothetical protein
MRALTKRSVIRFTAISIATGVLVAGGAVGTAFAEKPRPPCDPNGRLDRGEGCDPVGPVFRDGASCKAFGYDGGELFCTDTCQVDKSGCFSAGDELAQCQNDLAACEASDAECADDLGVCEDELASCNNALEDRQRVPATGQTGVFHAANEADFDLGDDGSVQAGSPLSYTTNDAGTEYSTYTDDNTKLVWTETLPGMHTWESVFAIVLALNRHCKDDQTVECSTDQDCIDENAGEECGFAGHQDWRLPNVNELYSIVDHGRSSPVASIPGTINSFYWSATTRQSSPTSALLVGFGGGMTFRNKNDDRFTVRAVRGGS